MFAVENAPILPYSTRSLNHFKVTRRQEIGGRGEGREHTQTQENFVFNVENVYLNSGLLPGNFQG